MVRHRRPRWSPQHGQPFRSTWVSAALGSYTAPTGQLARRLATPTTVANRTIVPRMRRHGLTPRAISSMAQTTRAAVPVTSRAVPALPEGWAAMRIATHASQVPSDQFGNWPTVMPPLTRSRKSQPRSRMTPVLRRQAALSPNGRDRGQPAVTGPLRRGGLGSLVCSSSW